MEDVHIRKERGMEFRKWSKIPRLNRDMVITEKIDGTNACVGVEYQALVENPEDALAVIEDYYIFAGSRKRWLVKDVKGGINDNFGFGRWVQENSEELFQLGPGRHYGEWWGQGIQRKYGLDHRKFSLFNTSMWGYPDERPDCCDVVPILYSGPFNTEMINMVVASLASGSVAAPGFTDPEGVVVFHTAANQLFKVTCKDDDVPKGMKR
jgi:hypothetical protein